MKKIIQNLYFEKSPLTVHLQIDPPRKEDARPFELSLTSDKEMVNKLVRCSGVLFDSDLEAFCKGLEKLADGGQSTMDYAPLEPTFLLRGQALPDGSVELLWVVDQGMAEASYSTDTGLGILMNVNPDVLIDLARDLQGILLSP